MIRKKKNVFYCEFCGKHSLAAWVITKHEKKCTMNPDRKCGLCKKDFKKTTEKIKGYIMDETMKKVMGKPRFNTKEIQMILKGVRP